MRQPWVTPQAKNRKRAAGLIRLVRPVVLALPTLPNKRPLREISFRLFMLQIAGKKETRKRTTNAE
jgi:hypothetical protein